MLTPDAGATGAAAGAAAGTGAAAGASSAICGLRAGSAQGSVAMAMILNCCECAGLVFGWYKASRGPISSAEPVSSRIVPLQDLEKQAISSTLQRLAFALLCGASFNAMSNEALIIFNAVDTYTDGVDVL